MTTHSCILCRTEPSDVPARVVPCTWTGTPPISSGPSNGPVEARPSAGLRDQIIRHCSIKITGGIDVEDALSHHPDADLALRYLSFGCLMPLCLLERIPNGLWRWETVTVHRSRSDSSAVN